MEWFLIYLVLWIRSTGLVLNFALIFLQDVLSPLPSLEVLHILEKSLTNLPEKLLQNASNIKEVKIKGDRIRRLSPKLFSGLTTLTTLNLVNNIQWVGSKYRTLKLRNHSNSGHIFVLYLKVAKIPMVIWYPNSDNNLNGRVRCYFDGICIANHSIRELLLNI